MFRLPPEDEDHDPHSLLGSILFEHMQSSGAMEEDDDDAVKCPVCNERHEFQPATAQRLSHGAMNVFVSSHCPICLEDNPSPPMAALPCGHLVCLTDFGRLGGLTATGERPPRRVSAQTRVPIPPGITSPEELLEFLMYMAQQGSEEEDTEPDEDMTRLYQRYSVNDGDSDYDDDSMPPLENPPDDARVSRPASYNQENRMMHAVSCQLVDQSELRSPRGGIWMWVPHGDHMDLMFLAVDHRCCQMEPTFRLDARPVFHPGGLYVSEEPYSADSDQWAVQYLSLNRHSSLKYMIPGGADYVSDGNGGLWVLSHVGQNKSIAFYNFRFRSGRVKRTLPWASRIYMDTTGGVWVHIRQNAEPSLEPGLWRFTSRDAKHRGTIDERAVCASDDSGGIWVVDVQGGRTRLSHYFSDEDRPVSTFTFPEGDCPFSQDISVVPITGSSGMGSMYLHCKRGQRWKLCVANVVGIANEICDLARSSTIAGDGDGGAWISKLERSSGRRTLFHIDTQHQIGDHGTTFPPHAKMIGW